MTTYPPTFSTLVAQLADTNVEVRRAAIRQPLVADTAWSVRQVAIRALRPLVKV
jgi:hypothetical protein